MLLDNNRLDGPLTFEIELTYLFIKLSSKFFLSLFLERFNVNAQTHGFPYQ